jgi:hypothetical protein
MTNQELSINTVMLIAIGKLYQEQATMLTGELKQRKKQMFNHSVESIDKFINEVEKLLLPDEIEQLQNITDGFHEALNSLRN